MSRSNVKLPLHARSTSGEILEAVEISLPEAGLPSIQHGLEVWVEVVGAEAVEPSVPSYQGGLFQLSMARPPGRCP